mgnify:CR=1 FL=1
MAGGKKYKFQGTTIQLATNFDASSPSGVISAVTKANPAVVTQTSHGAASGDVVRIQDVEGMTELEGEKFIIQRVDANSYRLLGTNSTDYGTFSSAAQADFGVWSSLCELTGYNRQGGTSPEIPGTSICSEAQEFEIGLPDYGTIQIDYNFAPQVSVQAALQSAYESGEVIGVKVTLPGAGGSMTLLGYVQQTSEQASVNGLWTGSLTLRVTGPRRDFAAA